MVKIKKAKKRYIYANERTQSNATLRRFNKRKKRRYK